MFGELAAVNALGIPTTRALSLISLPDIPVSRERRESSAVVARISPSFIRIGNFEAFNPPQDSGDLIYLFSGTSASTSQRNWEALRILGEWVVRRVLRLGRNEGEPWGRDLVAEVARRNAVMVAGWQAYGWMVSAYFTPIHEKPMCVTARSNQHRQYRGCRSNN